MTHRPTLGPECWWPIHPPLNPNDGDTSLSLGNNVGDPLTLPWTRMLVTIQLPLDTMLATHWSSLGPEFWWPIHPPLDRMLMTHPTPLGQECLWPTPCLFLHCTRFLVSHLLPWRRLLLFTITVEWRMVWSCRNQF